MTNPESEPRRVDPAVLEQRRARRHDKVVARMLGVVEGLLKEQDSYLDLSVEAIIEAGEMSRSTFYRYFDDKVDLIVALGDRAMSEIISEAQNIWELPPGASREQVAEAVRTTFLAYLPHTQLLSAVLEVSTYDKRARDHFGEVYALAQRGLAQHIRTGQQAGSVRPELHPEETAGWLTWMVERGIVQLTRDAGPAQLQRLHESLVAIIWRTLYEG